MRDHETPEIERQIEAAVSSGFLHMVRNKLSSDALEEANENDDPESYCQRFNSMIEELILEINILRNNPREIELRFKSDPNDPE